MDIERERETGEYGDVESLEQQVQRGLKQWKSAARQVESPLLEGGKEKTVHPTKQAVDRAVMWALELSEWRAQLEDLKLNLGCWGDGGILIRVYRESSTRKLSVRIDRTGKLMVLECEEDGRFSGLFSIKGKDRSGKERDVRFCRDRIAWVCGADELCTWEVHTRTARLS